MIGEGNIPSIHCKMSLRGPKCMRKVDGLSLILIDFYVQCSHHVSIAQTLLQFSENITLFVVCHIYIGVISKET
jgi:hypothetical protein